MKKNILEKSILKKNIETLLREEIVKNGAYPKVDCIIKDIMDTIYLTLIIHTYGNQSIDAYWAFCGARFQKHQLRSAHAKNDHPKPANVFSFLHCVILFLAFH